MGVSDEVFDIYSFAGEHIGTAPRRECHGNPALLHHSVQIFVFDNKGRILLQKRSAVKDIQPGRWDTSVGGHLACGEDYFTAARREMSEELGITEADKLPLEHFFDIQIRNDIESEDVRVFRTVCEGPFIFQREEIDEVRFFSADELVDPRWQNEFTPNLVNELKLIFPEKK